MPAPYVSTGIVVTFPGLSAELLDVEVGEAEAEQLDTTHQLSPGKWRKFLSGLQDGGEVTLLLHFGGTVPAIGSSGTLGIAIPDGAPAFSCTANVSKGGGAKAALGEKITAGVTFKVSGEPVWT